MRKILLEGREMTDKAAAHAHIARAMDFPQWYGNNLDALWDMLSVCGGAAVELSDAPAMLNALQSYGCRLLKCFYDAAEENPRISFTLI